MSILVVFNGDLRACKKALHYAVEICTCDRGKKIWIVNLTDISCEYIEEYLNGFDLNFHYLNYYDIYLEVDPLYRGALSEWLSQLLDCQPRFSTLEYCRLAEQNFAVQLFQELKELYLINYLLSQLEATRLIYLGNQKIRNCIQKYCEQRSVEFHVYRNTSKFKDWLRSISPYPKAVIIFSANVLSEVSLLIALRLLRLGYPKKFTIRGDIGVYALYPANWVDLDGKRCYRYTHNLFDHIDDDDSPYYLVSLLRTNSDSLRNGFGAIATLVDVLASPDMKKFRILEEFGSFGDLLRVYFDVRRLFNWYASWRRAKKAEIWMWQGVSVEPIMKDFLLSPLREIPKNIYTEKCSVNAAKTLSPRVLYLPVFELLEGRAVSSGHHTQNVEIIGIQHGILDTLQVPRIISSLTQFFGTIYAKQLPDLVAVEGEMVQQLFVANGFPTHLLRVVGAPRISIRTKENFTANDDELLTRVNVVVFDDGYASLCLLRLAQELSKCMPVIFKKHPSISTIRHERYYSQDGSEQLIIENRNISANELVEVYNPLAAICCLSGASLEMLKLGIPVIVFASNELATISPIVTNSSKVPVLNNASGVIEELVRLRNSMNYQRLRMSNGFDCATGLVIRYGNDASQRLAQLVSNRKFSKNA